MHPSINERSLKRFYAIYIVIIQPLFCLYTFGGTAVTISQIILFLLLIVLFLYTKKTNRLFVDRAYIPFAFYIIVHTVATLAVSQNVQLGKLICAVGQYLAYLLLLCFFNKRLFDKDLCKKYLLKTSDIVSIYLLFQQLMASLFGILIGGGLPFLHLKNEKIRTYVEDVKLLGLTYRPRSLFSEPAMYSTYVMLAFLILFCEKDQKPPCKSRDRRLILYLAGIILSKSTLGFVTLFAIIFISLLKRKKRFISRKSARLLSLEMFLTPVIVYLFFQSSSIQSQISRLTDKKFLNNEPRFRTLTNPGILDAQTPYKFFFGHDFILSDFPKNYFLPSFFRQFYCFGLVGLLILVVLLVGLYRRGNNTQRMILVAFIAQMLGAEIFHGGMMLFYFVWLSDWNSEKQFVGNTKCYTETYDKRKNKMVS